MKKSAASILRAQIAAPVLLAVCHSICSAQGAPQSLTPDSVVIGQCQGHQSQPGCVLPNLFGPNGLTLANNPDHPHFAHFIGSAQTTLNQTLSTAIATQLAILPIISPASGFTYKYDPQSGAFVRTTTSFGPVYTERAETIGRGVVSFGFSYQRFRFENLDGINLHSVPAVFTHVPETGAPYESDVITTTNNIDLNIDQTVAYGTVGLTNRIDLSVAIPIMDVRMGVSSNAAIDRVSGATFTPPTGGTAPNPHEFNLSGSLTNVYTRNGSASGLGDITFRAKGNVLMTDSLGVALAVDVRTPTGNAREFLGSGATGIRPFVIISGRRRFSPHLNLGYQWNGDSILAGNLTGATIGENASGAVTIQNGPAVARSLPDELTYAAGADFGATRRLTLSFDYLGQTLINAPRVFQSTFVTANIPGGTGSQILPTIAGGTDTIGLSSGAVGLKYNLFGKFLVIADVLFPLDNKGLRQDITPMIAISSQPGH